MIRRAAASLSILLFFVLFFLSRVDASIRVGEFAAQTSVGMASVLFSLSSAAVLMLPLSLCLMAFALISLLHRRHSPAMLLSALATLLFAGFLLMYSSEKTNFLPSPMSP